MAALILSVILLLMLSNTLDTVLFALCMGFIIYVFTNPNPVFTTPFTVSTALDILLWIASHTLDIIPLMPFHIADATPEITENTFPINSEIAFNFSEIVCEIDSHAPITIPLQFSHIKLNGNVMICHAAEIISPIVINATCITFPIVVNTFDTVPIISENFVFTPSIKFPIPETSISDEKNPAIPSANPPSNPFTTSHKPPNTSDIPPTKVSSPPFAFSKSPVNTPTMIEPTPDTISINPPIIVITGSIEFKIALNAPANTAITGIRDCAIAAPIILKKSLKPFNFSPKPENFSLIPSILSPKLIFSKNPSITSLNPSHIPLKKFRKSSHFVHSNTIIPMIAATAATTAKIGKIGADIPAAAAAPPPCAAAPIPENNPTNLDPIPITADIPDDIFPIIINTGANTAINAVIPTMVVCVFLSKLAILSANSDTFPATSDKTGKKTEPSVIPASCI